MEFTIVDASDSNKYKGTIQSTGRLSFNTDAAKQLMELSKRQYFKVGFDKTDSSFKKIYLIDSDEDPVASKIYRSGLYYYIKLDKPLNKFNIDFKNYSFSFTIEKSEKDYEGREVFVLTRKGPHVKRTPEDIEAEVEVEEDE
jgi:hypothetical protein